MLPEIGGVDAAVFDVRESEALGMNVVDGEQAGDVMATCDSRDQAGHPVVAMDQVGPDFGDGVIDDFALEGEGDVEVILIAVDFGTVIEGPVFGEVDALRWEGAGDFFEFVIEDFLHVEVEHLPVVGQGDVDIGAEVVECLDERGGDVGESSRLGRHALGEVSHASRQIRDFWGDDEDPGPAIAVLRGLFRPRGPSRCAVVKSEIGVCSLLHFETKPKRCISGLVLLYKILRL